MGEISYFSQVKKKKKKAESRAKRTAVIIYFSEGLSVPKLFSCFGSSHPTCTKMRQCSVCCYTVHKIPEDPRRVKTKRKHKEKKMKQESLVFAILSVLHCTTSPNLTVVFKMSDLPMHHSGT